jgi:2-dehydropantoate 2-reductase
MTAARPPAGRLRIAVMGAGGLGAYYGGMLARAGHPVHFIARGAHLAALRQGGLHVESPHVGDFHLPHVDATDDPATIGPVDWVLVGVKAYDLEAASRALRPLLHDGTSVLPLLNGMDMAERIGAVIGPQRVLGGTVILSCNLAGPGRIRHVFNGPLKFGELAGGRSDRTGALEQAFRAAGVLAEAADDVRREIWHKYIVVSPLAAVSSVVRLATRQVAAHPDTRALYEGAAREVHALARASGVAVAEDAVARALAFIDGVSAQHTVSTLLDLRAGRRLELDALLGAAVRLGERLRVPTPICRVLHAALRPYEDGPPPPLAG